MININKIKKINLVAMLAALSIINVASLYAQPDSSFIQQQKVLSRNAFEEGNRNKQKLMAEGKWNMNATTSIVYLKTPIEEMPGMHEYGYFRIPFCVDRLPNSSDILDWACHYNYAWTKSYDGMTGTLFEYTDYGYNTINQHTARIVAAADGIIVAKGDGNFDRNCTYVPGLGNYIAIEHSNGSRTYYYHLQNGTQTSKPIGTHVNEGELIGYPGGFVDSYSVGPYQQPSLFFELRDISNNVIDPFGSYNCLGVPTQYYTTWKDSTYLEDIVLGHRITRLSTLKHMPNSSDNCANPIYIYNNHFNPGDSMYVQLRFNNYRFCGDSFLLNIFNPLGIPVFNTYVRNRLYSNCLTLSDLENNLRYKLPTSGALMIPGTYTIALNYEESSGYNHNYYHYFTVGCQANYSSSLTRNGEAGIIVGNTIHSYETCNSGSRVKYIAGNEVILHPGFTAYEGSNVMIYNESCIVPPRLAEETENVSTSNELIVSPNPTSDKLKLNLNISIEACEIYDAMGHLVYRTNVIDQNEINVSQLKPGMYLITVLSNGEKLKTRFVKM